MRVRNLMALTAVVLLSVGVATAAAAPKQPYPASQKLCLGSGGDVVFSTKANSSFYTPFYKKQGVLWTCNMYTDPTATSALVQSCSGDGGYPPSTLVSGEFTCWKNPGA